jgi:hypothetical protein
MYVSLFRGEWLKIAGNRWATSFLMWIFPVGMAIISFIAILLALFSDDYAESQRLLGIDPWNETMLSTWQVINNIVGRWIIIAFTAVVFATEYRHGTWKNLITRRSRVTLIVNKYVTVSVFVTVAAVLFSVVAFLGAGAVAVILDIDYGLSNFGDVLPQFLEDYGLQMFTTLAATFISATFAAFAAMLAKNIMASVIVGILLYMLEYVGFFILMGLLSGFLNIDISPVYQFLPSYNLDNITSWVVNGEGLLVSLLEQDYTAHPLGLSLLIVAVWVVLMVSLTVYAFYRQDIST